MPAYIRLGAASSSDNIQYGDPCLEPLAKLELGCKLTIMASIVCMMCFGSLLFSQQLVTSIPTQQFLSFGRSIRSWTNNEIEPVNKSRDIEIVLNLQRLSIAKEMKGYLYPNGQFNISAKRLKDLVPEKGGNPIRSIIVTTWRSGSTFIGDILNSIPGNYYHYEPLLDHGIVQIRGPPLANKALQNLKQLLTCNYTGMENYLNYGSEHNWLFTHNTRLWERCVSHPHICWNSTFLNKFCSLFPFQSMKLVRMRLRLLEPLLENPKLNIRILLVVRDPRGTIQSRRHRDWCPGNPDCSDSSLLCADLIADYTAALRFQQKFPIKFKVMRYEDVSVNPYSGAEKILKFFGFSLHRSVKKFLDTHTKMNAGGVSSTFRNSRTAPFHWRYDLKFDKVQNIQRDCGSAMNLWGYTKAVNATHQRIFNPVVRPFKLV